MAHIQSIKKYKESRNVFIENIDASLKNIIDNLTSLTNQKILSKFSYYNSDHISPLLIIAVIHKNEKILLGAFENLDLYKNSEIKNNLNEINDFIFILNNNFRKNVPKVESITIYCKN